MKIKSQLKSLGVRPTKERGQNFLLDEGAISEIVRFGAPKSSDKIIEIGPGLGALTRELARVAPLTVIEVEQQFCTKLKGELPNIEVIQSDVRLVNFEELGNNLLVFGNLPYSLSSEIIFHILSFHKNIKRAVFLLQKEFVERIGAPPGGKDYGALSVGCQLYAHVRFGPVFPGNLFHPPTKVESQMVELTMKEGQPGGLSDYERSVFQMVVRAAFFNRRKKIVNSMALSKFGTEAEVSSMLAAAGIDESRRAETVSLAEYVSLAKIAANKNK
jgi:16S rRNA (adenine1518-N6/adenine1519-N6)-dimethyltransferase